MAMKVNGNLSDFSVRNRNYGSYKKQSMADYVNELAKLAPSVKFRVGNTFPSARSGKTLTINPGILNKMQNDPEQEKDMKDMIKGVEFITRFMDSIYKIKGCTVVYRHSYIDENGKYRAWSCVKKNDKLSPRLRAQRQKSMDNLVKKTRERTAEKKKEQQKKSEDTKTKRTKENSAYSKVEQFIEEKLSVSEDGAVFLSDAEFRMIVEAAREDAIDKTDARDQTVAGANVDLQV